MKLQTTLSSRRNGSIKVNGTAYVISDQGVVEVSDADGAKLLTLGREWTKDIVELPVSAVAIIEQRKNAAQFVDAVQADPSMEAEVAQIRSFPGLLSYATSKGFYFSKAELDAAKAAWLEKNPDRVAEAKAAVAQTLQEQAKEPVKEAVAVIPPRTPAARAPTLEASPAAPPAAPSDPALKQSPQPLPHCFLDRLPVQLPEEVSGEWPDPVMEMSRPYLLRMAAAYEVRVPGNTGKPKLVAKLRSEIFEPDDKDAAST